MKLTDAEIAAMPPKSVRYEEEVKLYRENDFITAYGLHTEKRIRETSYKHAIGGGENWEEHGDLQFRFLIRQGLSPGHRLLDIGCGTGRLARKVVPYLTPCSYVGIDISKGALRIACDLAESEGWEVKAPVFAFGDVTESLGQFDFAWAFSVFIHLPQEVMIDVMKRVVARLRDTSSQFLFSYVPEPKAWRSGLKQFRHTLGDYKAACAVAGLTFDDVPDWVENTLGVPVRPKWAGNQRVAVARKLA